jgi:outer membrane protein TolC
MKLFLTLISGILVSGSLLHAEKPRLVDEKFLADLRSEAARQQPAPAAAALRTKAAASDIRSIRLWDDPMVGLSLMAANPGMRRNEGDVRISLEQPLPKPGLYAATRAKAEALQRASIENARSSRLESGAEAARDAIELALADESITLQTSQIEWLESMAENARGMAINPDASATDSLRLESELARENEVLAAARRTRDRIAQTLNLRLGRPLESPWKPLRITVSPAPVPIASAEIARIPRVNPTLRAMREMASAASSDTAIADRDRQPQFSVAVESALYSGGDVRSAGVGLKMSLPFFNRSSYDARVLSSQFREKAAVKDVETTRLAIADAVLTSVTDIANASAQARAYAGNIYQKSLAATRSVESAWISSNASLTDLLDSNRQLFSIRLEQRRFVAMQLAALEELNVLVPRNSSSK